MRYSIASPDEYLAVTGLGIEGIKICKSRWIWPLQKVTRFSVMPHDYSMNLPAMTKEKLQFLLPVVFTVGPEISDRRVDPHLLSEDGEGAERIQPHAEASLTKYAMLLAGQQDSGSKSDDHRSFLEGIVKGIIEGETRVIVSAMTMEEIFTERESFKRRIFRNIQGELDQFGLKIYNANVPELRDAPGSIYFESLSRKAHEGATNQARIDVAEAQLRGNVGEAQRTGEQEREIAKINADTAVQKTQRDIERAQAEATLATRKTSLSRDVEIARIEADRATQSKDEDLKKQVELKRAAAEIERLRASDVVHATVDRESRQQAVDAEAYKTERYAAANATAEYGRTCKAADARAYEAKAEYERTCKVSDAKAYDVTNTARAESEQITKKAEAKNYAAVQAAEAELERVQKEAEGLSAMADAYGKLAQAFGGPQGLIQYMLIEKGTYVELAKANAAALQGMNPKISVWNTGSGHEGSSSQGTEAMRNVYQMLPPLMTTINEQTGITLPEWQFGTMANQVGEVQKAGAVSKAQKNGRV